MRHRKPRDYADDPKFVLLGLTLYVIIVALAAIGHRIISMGYS